MYIAAIVILRFPAEFPNLKYTISEDVMTQEAPGSDSTQQVKQEIV